MKYQLVADNMMEEEALRSNPVARVLFDPFLPVLQARAIVAAARLGVFVALGDKARSPEHLARTLNLDQQALQMLLRLLACAGYVVRDGQCYRLSEPARATLLADSPACLAGWVEYNVIHWRVMDGLEELLRTGQGLQMEQCLHNDSEWGLQQQAMLETARPAAPAVAAMVPICAGATRMLDVGGSHGLYSALICRAHPPMQADVLELPQAVEHARKLARQEGITDVVTHRAGNVLDDDLGHEVYDAVLLGNIVHHFDAATNQQLLHRIRAALRPGGTVAIWDFSRPEAEAEPDLVGDGLALFFRLTSTAEVYTSREHTSWLQAAGFVDLRMEVASPAQVLVTGRAGESVQSG